MHKRRDYPGNIYDCALGDKSGEAVLHFRRTHKDGGTLNKFFIDKEDDPTIEVDVKVSTLDILFPDIHNFAKPILLWLVPDI